MNRFEEKLEKYAELAVKVGLNLQKGQLLVLRAPIAAAEYVRKVTKKAYEAGARDVYVDWSDEECTLIKFMNAPEETLKEYPMWKARGFEEMSKEGAAFLSISASNPDLLKAVDPAKIAMANKAASLALEEHRRYVQSGKISWNIVSVPTKEWAAKIFPGVSEEESMAKLWENIFNVTRINTEDPVQAWKEHIKVLNEKMAYLNGKKFKKLHYKAPGTDLIVELPKDHVWIGGGIETDKGIYFVPNMPTEEVFTAPLKEGVNGTLRSTKPLNYGGTVIENFAFTFEKGKIIDFTAEKGYETLKGLIETDLGSHYLGEVALVPHHSPVSDSNIIFYNTLFDENASCHFAIGNVYPLSLKDGGKMSKEELEKNGVNTSLTHVDFMVGSAEMNIDGITEDGSEEAIFKNGNWAW